jgi:hypothetical protein
MKKLLFLLLFLTAFTSNAQRTMLTGQNNYLAPVVTFQPLAIVTSGLITYLDASDPTKYNGNGSKSYQKPLNQLRVFFYDIFSIKYSRKSNIWFEDKSISYSNLNNYF